MSSAYDIYTGPWVNHSHGAVLGATITLTNRDAGFLLAVLVTLVGLAGRSLWSIISHVTHQLRSTREPRNALFYQQQVILRNAHTPLGAASSFARLSFAWRNHRQAVSHYRGALFFFIAAPLIVASAFGVAGIFASKVQTAAGSSFLLKGDSCGYWTFVNTTLDIGPSVKLLNDATNAANYARNCYEGSNSTASQCNSYSAAAIPYTVNKNASCPFQSGSCLWSDTAAYLMDTGNLDSHEFLGLNAPLSERIVIRKATTCAPISVGTYIEVVNKTVEASLGVAGTTVQDTYLQLFMGPLNGIHNYTYAYNTHASVVGAGYDLAAISPNWEPIPEFNSSVADVTLFVLAANSVVYAHPTSDTLFSANVAYTATLSNKTITLYISDHFLRGLMCAESYQVCNPNVDGQGKTLPNCTELTSYRGLSSGLARIGLNARQLATAHVLSYILLPVNMYGAVYGRGASALKAQRSVIAIDGPEQAAQLPSGQWQLEVDGWFGASLALLQQRLVEFASGPTDVLALGGQILPPSDSFEKSLCRQQLVQNVSGYQNFNTLGVFIILALGTTLILVGLCTDSIVGIIQRAMGKHHARLSWNSDGYLQLQRMAYEGAAYDGWKKCASKQPVFGESKDEVQMLGALDVWDINHPRLSKRSGVAAEAS